MTPLKSALFVEIRKNYSESVNLNDEQLNKLLFHHSDSLRLSLKGFLVVKNIFTAYSFEMPETIKSKHQRSLAKLEFPYYFTKSNSRLILFSEMDACVIKLHGGVKSFLETFCNVE